MSWIQRDRPILLFFAAIKLAYLLSGEGFLTNFSSVLWEALDPIYYASLFSLLAPKFYNRYRGILIHSVASVPAIVLQAGYSVDEYHKRGLPEFLGFLFVSLHWVFITCIKSSFESAALRALAITAFPLYSFWRNRESLPASSHAMMAYNVFISLASLAYYRLKIQPQYEEIQRDFKSPSCSDLDALYEPVMASEPIFSAKIFGIHATNLTYLDRLHIQSSLRDSLAIKDAQISVSFLEGCLCILLQAVSSDQAEIRALKNAAGKLTADDLSASLPAPLRPLVSSILLPQGLKSTPSAAYASLPALPSGPSSPTALSLTVDLGPKPRLDQWKPVAVLKSTGEEIGTDRLSWTWSEEGEGRGRRLTVCLPPLPAAAVQCVEVGVMQVSSPFAISNLLPFAVLEPSILTPTRTLIPVGMASDLAALTSLLAGAPHSAALPHALRGVLSIAENLERKARAAGLSQLADFLSTALLPAARGEGEAEAATFLPPQRPETDHAKPLIPRRGAGASRRKLVRFASGSAV